VHDLAVSPNGKLLAAGFGDGTAKIWRTTSGGIQQTLTGTGHAVWSVTFSPDGEELATAGEDKTVRIYDVTTGELELDFTEHLRPLRCIVFSPDGKLAASAGLDSTIHVWDSHTGRVRHSFQMRGSSIRSLAFHPDGRRLAGGGAGPDVSIFDVVSGEEVWTEHWNTPLRVWDLAFSPDGNLVAIARGDGAVRLRNADDGTLVHKFGDLAEDLPVALAFSSNGRRLATATARTAVSLWETSSGRSTLSLSHDPATAGVVAFSPDGQALITGGVDGTVRLWPTIDYQSDASSDH
jgi:WD40 repeat protein